MIEHLYRHQKKTLMWLLSGGNLSYTDFPVATLWMANKMNHSEFSMFKMFCRLFCHHHTSEKCYIVLHLEVDFDISRSPEGQIVTPFAQILASLKEVSNHKQFMTYTSA